MANVSDDSPWFSNLPHTWSAPMQPTRTPLFNIPSITISPTLSTPELEFYFFNVPFWIGLIVVFSCLTILGTLMGCILYHYCVRPEVRFTPTSYLVAYGFVLPFWLIFPAMTSQYFRVYNKIYRFTLTTCITSICAFRTTAAVHGFSPAHTTTSRRRFVFYYAAPILSKYDSKTQKYIRTTRSIRLWALAKTLGMVFVAGMMSSALHMFPEYFPALAKDPTTVWYDWNTIFNLSNLKDNLIYAAFFQVYLTTFAQGMEAIQMIATRLQTEQTMNNPVFEATSPSNFWGRRWNLMIHDVLKRGVFLPVRSHSSSAVALVATFAASGFFHEWLQLTVLPSWDHDVLVDGSCRLKGYEEPVASMHCYSPEWGASMAFFLWQAALIALEFALAPYCKRFMVYVPNPVKTLMTIVAGGCVAHWFAEPYVHSNYFLDADAALFLIKRARS